MAMQTGQSVLLSKYGDRIRQAAAKTANNEINYGFQRLPGGINNGIARLTAVEVGQVEQGKQNAGEYYFRAAGVVMEPAAVVVNGTEMAVRGLQTSVIRMFCDTMNADGKVTSLEENVAWIQNELKKLAGAGFDVSDVERAINELKAYIANPRNKPIYFKFSTQESKPQLVNGKPKLNPATGKPYEPRVFENWYGTQGMENWVPAEVGGVTDKTPSANGATPGGGAAVTVEGGDGSGDSFNEFAGGSEEVDLGTLVASANAGDDEAIAKLSALALAAGASDDDVTNAENWEAVAAMVEAGQGGGGEPEAGAEAEAEAPAEVAPAKGDVRKYKVIDPKTKKPAMDPKTKKERRPIDVEILTVNPKGETVTVKDVTTKQTLVGPDKKPLQVKWADLI